MREYRRRPRKNTPHRTNVLDADTDIVLGRIVDITADGLMVVSQRQFDIGQVHNLKIVLPVMLRNRSDITVEAKVVWSSPDSNPSYHRAGFQFLNLAGDDGFLLEDVLHKFNLVG